MQQLKQLGLTQLDQALPALYETARQEQWTDETFFSRAMAAEIEGRDRRAAERRMSAARLPTLKTLEAFDFAFQPSLSQRLVWELAALSFVQTTTNVRQPSTTGCPGGDAPFAGGGASLIRSRGRANGTENPVGCHLWRENEEGVKIIPAQNYAGVDTDEQSSVVPLLGKPFVMCLTSNASMVFSSATCAGSA